ncbi:atypical chemokine receptor 3-like isoform X2 [Oncorhynchus clarkii lewisi]|uniref:atypical chemokine receptor 3-like isoform X2 n=1 Tax=Oncorhynchus clarkii lewisi TaxID=490388 RepID=UPI0039B8963B
MGRVWRWSGVQQRLTAAPCSTPCASFTSSFSWSVWPPTASSSGSMSAPSAPPPAPPLAMRPTSTSLTWRRLTCACASRCLCGSIFFLACMSVDRYLSVTRPADSEDGGRRRKLIRRSVCVGVWLLALVASLPDTYFLQAVRSSHGEVVLCRPVYPEEHSREWMVGVQLSFILLGFVLPFPVIALAYALLAQALSSTSCSSSAMEQERRVSRRVILAYTVVFLGCWGPYHGVLLADALSLLGLVPLSCGLENALYVALHLTQCLSLLHCCFNPILYNFLNRNYRYDLMKAFIFKYSTRTGLTRLIEQPHISETEYSAVAVENPPQI